MESRSYIQNKLHTEYLQLMPLKYSNFQLYPILSLLFLYYLLSDTSVVTDMPIFLSSTGCVPCSYLNIFSSESKYIHNCQTLAKIFPLKNIFLLFYCNLMAQLSGSY